MALLRGGSSTEAAAPAQPFSRCLTLPLPSPVLRSSEQCPPAWPAPVPPQPCRGSQAPAGKLHHAAVGAACRGGGRSGRDGRRMAGACQGRQAPHMSLALSLRRIGRWAGQASSSQLPACTRLPCAERCFGPRRRPAGLVAGQPSLVGSGEGQIRASGGANRCSLAAWWPRHPASNRLPAPRSQSLAPRRRLSSGATR